MNKILVVAAALLVSGTTFAGAPTKTTMPVASTPAAASTVGGWYVGAGANYNAVTKAPGFDQKWGFGLFVGQRLNNWFGHELNFSKIGNVNTAMKDDQGNPFNMSSIYHTSYDVYGYLPIVKGVEVFAKGGVSFLSFKLDGEKTNRFTLNYGVGAQYTYQQFGVRASYTRLTDSESYLFSAMKDVIGLDAFYRLG